MAREIVAIHEELVTVTERNRNAGHSFRARTAEPWYQVEYSDGTTDGDFILWPAWAKFLKENPN